MSPKHITEQNKIKNPNKTKRHITKFKTKNTQTKYTKQKQKKPQNNKKHKRPQKKKKAQIKTSKQHKTKLKQNVKKRKKTAPAITSKPGMLTHPTESHFLRLSCANYSFLMDPGCCTATSLLWQVEKMTFRMKKGLPPRDSNMFPLNKSSVGRPASHKRLLFDSFISACLKRTINLRFACSTLALLTPVCCHHLSDLFICLQM